MIFQDKVIEEYDILFSDDDDYTLDLSINLTDDGESVDILHPEEVRWFYQTTKTNIPRAFSSYDSLRLETKYQELSKCKGVQSIDSENEKIVVKSNLFEVDVKQRSCSPIYWSDDDDEYKVYRGTWFRSDTFLPLSELFADAIESQHMMQFGALCYSWVSNLPQKSRKVLHTMEYGDQIVIWHSIKDVCVYKNKSVTRFMNRWKILSPGVRIRRGYKNKAQFDYRPVEITHLCFVVHGIGQKLECKINKDCHKLKHNCKKILKSNFTAEQIGDFRLEFLPIEWRTGLNLDGGIIDSITPNEFKGLRTIFNSTIMDILYYSSSLYRTEITQGLEFELNRLYSMFCARNPYFETKGGKVSILAHSLGSVICYDIIRSWSMQGPESDGSLLVHSLFQESEEILSKIDQINVAKLRILELEDEIRSYYATQTIKKAGNGFRNPNFPSNFKEGSRWRKVTEIENFFTMGSPLPVFLALRGLKPHGCNTHSDILPTKVCKRIFNIFHPSDPVAYRLEPLIIEDYINIRPIHIESLSKSFHLSESDNDLTATRTTDEIPSESMSQTTRKSSDSGLKVEEPEQGNANSTTRHSFTDQISETMKKLSHRRKSLIPAVEELQIKMKNLKSLPLFKRITMFVNILKGDDGAGGKESHEAGDDESSYESTHACSPLEHRLDYTLGDEQNILSFISLFTSHTSYWNDQSLAKFLLDQILTDYKNQSAI